MKTCNLDSIHAVGRRQWSL